MIQLVWFLVKIGLIVAGAVWLAARPGKVDITWMDYDITIHFGFFLLIFFFLLLITMALTRFGLFFSNMPGRRKFKKTIKNNEKGLEALTLSLSSAAAGDYGYAQFQAERALKLLPGDSQPIPLLLKAGAQRKQGDHKNAEETLKTMLNSPEGAVLAARALIGNAVEQNDLGSALSYARTAERDYKGKDKNWLLSTLYELEAKAGNWQAAEDQLYKAIKKKAVTKEKGNDDFIAILTAHALQNITDGDLLNAERLLKLVLKKDAAFPPAVTELCKIYLKQSKQRPAAALLKKAWAKSPHPSFVPLWKELGALFNKKREDISWLRKLTAQNASHVESYLALAHSNLNAGNYDYAKQDLDAATALSHERRIYRLWAKYAEKTGGSDATIHQYMEEVTEAKADPTWTCSVSGMTFPSWSAVCPALGTFNTITWVSPDDIKASANNNLPSEFYEMLTAS